MTTDQSVFSLCLAAAVAAVLRRRTISSRGRVGRALVAIRDHPIAAETMGVDAALYKTICFGVSAFYAGVAGGLDAIAVGFVSPESFRLALSLAFLVGIVDRRPRLDRRRACSARCSSNSCPTIADQLTVYFGENAKALPGAVYGLLMILMMAVGARGRRRAAAPGRDAARRGARLETRAARPRLPEPRRRATPCDDKRRTS